MRLETARNYITKNQKPRFPERGFLFCSRIVARPSRPRYYAFMKKWIDPVKNQPAKESTLNTTGDFGEFTALMRRIVNKQEEKPKPASSSPDPAAS